jgi:hypothetical protein
MSTATVPESVQVLPAIETWWGYLTSGARHALMASPGERFAPRVREEVERATGMTVAAETRLSESDRRFLAAQDEEVR